jgi:hypothetical protein
LSKVGSETRVLATPTYSRTPVFSPSESGVFLSWVEETPAGTNPTDEEAAHTGLRIVQIDEKGGAIGMPVLVRGDKGSPVVSGALGCHSKGCRGVLAASPNGSMILGAFEFEPGKGPGTLKTIGTLTGGFVADFFPVFADSSANWLFFGDDAVSGAGRVRWMTMAWP